MANIPNPEAWGVQFGLDTTMVLPPMPVEPQDREIGLIQESRAARVDMWRFWSIKYATRR